MVQWFGLSASTAGGVGLIPGPWSGNQDAACHTVWPKKKKKNVMVIVNYLLIFCFFQTHAK